MSHADHKQRVKLHFQFSTFYYFSPFSMYIDTSTHRLWWYLVHMALPKIKRNEMKCNERHLYDSLCYVIDNDAAPKNWRWCYIISNWPSLQRAQFSFVSCINEWNHQTIAINLEISCNNHAHSNCTGKRKTLLKSVNSQWCDVNRSLFKCNLSLISQMTDHLTDQINRFWFEQTLNAMTTIY